MVTKVKAAVETATNGAEEVHKPLFELARKVLLASIGAVALAQDEIEDFVERLIERGEIAEKDGRKLIREVMDKRKKDAEKAEDEVSKRVEDVLDRMNVPTKADIEALGEKITTLSKKVDELKKTPVA
jgi:poly(hydroxyalkanoate) granule-associated protein